MHVWCGIAQTIVEIDTTWIHKFQTRKFDEPQEFPTTKPNLEHVNTHTHTQN